MNHIFQTSLLLTLVWVGSLGVCFEVEEGGGGGERGVKLAPSLKLVKIMLEAWNLVRKYTNIFSSRKYTF